MSIRCNNYKSPRTCDGVQVKTRFSIAYVEASTHKAYSEIPDGADAADYKQTFGGRLRCDQTGILYECAHDTEDAPYTYTEVFPDPRMVSEFTITNNSFCRMNLNTYPDYDSTKVYAQGDIVVYDRREWVSDFNDNTGNQPNIYGWTLHGLTVEVNDPVYYTAEEYNAIIDEMNAEEGE